MYISTFKSLLHSDFKIFAQTFKDSCFDLLIWISSMALVTYYVMPSFGLSHEYTLFLIASSAASAGLFLAWGATVTMVADFSGEQIITYYLTLPLPSWLVFIRTIIINAFNAFLLSMLVLPVCTLLLWNKIHFASLHVGKYMLIMVLMSLLHGAFPLILASLIKSLNKIGSLWMRFIYPLWFFGCFQFSWYSLYHVSRPLAYLDLLNPFTYVMEGMRAAVLDTQTLPFGLCAVMITVFGALAAWVGIVRLKKQLDCL